MLSQPRSRRTFTAWADVPDTDWDDWHWQFRNRIASPEQLEAAFPLTAPEREAARRSRDLFRLGITPHWATLIDSDDPHCPMRRQAIPLLDELSTSADEHADPLGEDAHRPVPGVVHRYPDRVLLLVTHECPLYCRYCTRRRIVGDHDGNHSATLHDALDYIRGTPAVRDVLISGGEPLSLGDRRLEEILAALRAIPHVEIVRIGTRAPAAMPQRITPALVAMLRRYHPLWLNTHFNHPLELAPAATRAAMERLVDAGIPTGNQTVLLAGVNDCPTVMKRLLHELVKLRCRPYYLYSCDHSQGLSHFRVRDPAVRGRCAGRRRQDPAAARLPRRRGPAAQLRGPVVPARRARQRTSRSARAVPPVRRAARPARTLTAHSDGTMTILPVTWRDSSAFSACGTCSSE